MRVVKIAFILLLGLLGLLLVLRFIFLDQVTEYALQKAGAKAVSVHGLELGWDQAHIDVLAATRLLPGGDTFSIELHDVTFYYDVKELFAGGQNIRIYIGKATVYRKQSVEKTDISFTLPDQIELLSDELRATFPVGKLTIQELQLQGDFPSLIVDESIQVSASIEQRQILVAEIAMAMAGETRLAVDLRSPDPLQGRLKAVLQGKDDEEILKLHLFLKPERCSGTFGVQAKALRTFLLAAGVVSEFPEGSADLQIDIDFAFPGTDEKTFSISTIATKPAFSGWTASKVQVELSASIVGDRLLLGPESFLLLDELRFGKSSLEKISLDLGGSFSKTNEQFLFELFGQQQLQLTGLFTGKLRVAELNVVLNSPVELLLQKENWSLLTSDVHFEPMQVLEGDRVFDSGLLRCRDFSLFSSSSGMELQTGFSLPELAIEFENKHVSLKELSGTVQHENSQVSGSVQLAPKTVQAQLQVDFSHDLTTDSGNAQVKTVGGISLNAGDRSLAGMFSTWSYPFNLDGGQVVFQADGAWQPDENLQLSTSFSVTDGRGYYKGILFNGLALQHDLAVLPQLYSRTSGTLAIGQLIGGIDVFDIGAEVSLLPVESGPLPQVKLKDFSASMFDGEVRSREVDFDLNAPNSSFSVEIESLDLGELVALINMDTLNVIGSISGTIPVVIKGSNVSVDAGELHSDEPGEIRYAQGTRTQSGLAGYALRAVEEMQYQMLQVEANYHHSGQLDLDIALQGVSPGLDTTRPVHLNIHAEQNLPALLQSLRFSRGLTEELDKRVKQRYK